VFVELMPLLAGRTVMITVAREDEKTLRVNVIPCHPKTEGRRKSGAQHAAQLHWHAGGTGCGTGQALGELRRVPHEVG